MTHGGPTTQITVNGGAFLPNEHMTLYWDQPNKVAGSAVADGNGNFAAPNIKPFAGDDPGLHKICASVPPNPCANFTLDAPTPTPSPSPTPTESPTPTPVAAPTPSLTPTPVASINGIDVITHPPFVFLPLIGLAAIALSLGYWILTLVRRPRQMRLPSAAVVHRAMRPDYSAGFGAPPAAAPPELEPSAWSEAERARPPVWPPESSQPPEPAAPEPVWDTEANPTQWGTGEPDTGYQFPPPEEQPEQPGDLSEPLD